MLLDKKFWLGFALIFVIAFIVYYPSFEHLLRGETYTYFLDTKGHTSVWDLVTGWATYEKVRIYDPGDRWLFKPLLFTIVGIEKALFGINYVYWRIASFAMHMIAVFSLYRLLWRIKSGLLAIAVGVFFAVLYMLVNAVLYEQVSSYALFTALVINALYYIYVKEGRYLAATSMLVASFINETGVIITAVFAFYVWVTQGAFHVNWKSWVKVFGLIIPFFFAVYFTEKFISPAQGMDIEFRNIVSLQTIEVGLRTVPKIIGTWIQYISFPSMYSLVAQPNLRSYSSVILQTSSGYEVYNILALVGIAGVIGYILWRKGSGQYQFAKLMASILIIFVAVISVFRTNTHGVNYILENSFNSYMFGAWFLVLFYAIATCKPSPAIAVWGLTGMVLILSFISGLTVYNLNQTIKNGEQPLREYFAHIDSFVAEHKEERGFTFRAILDNPLEKDLVFSLWTVIWHSPPEKVMRTYKIPEVLYLDYWDETNPKYVVEYP